MTREKQIEERTEDAIAKARIAIVAVDQAEAYTEIVNLSLKRTDANYAQWKAAEDAAIKMQKATEMFHNAMIRATQA